MRNYPVQMLNAINTISQTGSAVFVGQEVQASFTAVNGDTAAGGTLKIQGSNEAPVGLPPNQYIPSNTSFCDIPNATSTIASGVGPAIVIPSLSFQYIRVIYTSTDAGNSKIIVNATLLAV